MSTLAITSSIILIIVVFLLVGLLVATFTGQDSDRSAMIANALMRTVEGVYCLVILGVYRTRVMAPSSSSSNHISRPTIGTVVETNKDTVTTRA